jgi:hypothetical protein
MRAKRARAHSETEQRLHTLNAWSETPFYLDRERVALECVEAVTLVCWRRVPLRTFEAGDRGTDIAPRKNRVDSSRSSVQQHLGG